MPKASPLFNEMTRRINKLKGKLMARQISKEKKDPIGYKFDAINAAAFRLLVHAEIEEYIETKAMLMLAEIKRDVNIHGYKTKYFVNIFAISKQLDIPLCISTPNNDLDFKSVIINLITQAELKISKNNGIKEHSFLPLAVFSGFDPSIIDPLLLANLESYGKGRGAVAHKSFGRVRTFLAPSAEVNDALALVRKLRYHFYKF